MPEPKQTPLYEVQAAAGARFVPFAGFAMPVQFAGVIAEHLAVRERVGLFDVSHMGEIRIEGPQAADAVQYVVTNNVGQLGPGGARYTVMCAEDGGIVDDLIVYREAASRFFLCVNASRLKDDLAHISAAVAPFACSVTDISKRWAQLALQGPAADLVLGPLTTIDLQAIKPFGWCDAQVAAIPGVRVARTGYTGEHGYELYCAAERAPDLWRALMHAGEPHGLALCGLGARDTLRLEMKYPLYGNDIDLAHNPYEAGLGWVVKLRKGDFLGRTALQRVKQEGPRQAWVGLKVLDRGIPRQGCAISLEGRTIGVVTSGTYSPSLKEAIATGYVPTEHAGIGSSCEIMVRNKRIRAQVVETPFYRRGEG